MAYPDWALFVSEMCAMCVAITIGECLIANEVLKRTKGHELGLGFVAIGFGMAFFVAIEMFGGVSASCNPAMFLAKGVAAKKDWRRVLIGMVADFIGAFIGAVFVWLLYLGHFSLVPEPPATFGESVESEDEGTAKKMKLLQPLLDPVNVMPEHTRNSFISYTGRDPAQRQMSLLYQGGDDLRQRGPRATMQSVEFADPADTKGTARASIGSVIGQAMTRGTAVSGSIQMAAVKPSIDITQESQSDLLDGGQADLEYSAYEAALVQDQNAKLSVFATRPAIVNFGYNFLVEFVGTFFLIYCALLIEERPFFLSDESYEQFWKAFAEPFFIGWMVVALVMAMAGPTGYAANPARDMGPRIAHFLLPIPNKGPSEFWYSWVPFTASYLGGFVAGLAFWCTKQIFLAGNAYPAWSLPAASRPLFGAWTF